MKKVPLIIAMDEIQDLDAALRLAGKIGNRVEAIKIHNLYDKYGPSVTPLFLNAGASKLWVDYKIYDIPNTADLRSNSIKADILSVHCSGGVAMMQKAVASGKEIFAVTVLTSHTEEEVRRIYNRSTPEQVMVFAHMAHEAGIKNIVCSPQELLMLRAEPLFAHTNFVVPGIRSVGVDANEQQRIATPVEAIKNGAKYLVMGRQITLAADPVAALDKVEEELAALAA